MPFPPYLVMWNPMSSASPNAKTHSVKLNLKKVRLRTGDYQLEGSEDRIIIERKAHLDETAVNCLYARPRRLFIDELQRLRTECARPILVMEGDPLRLEHMKGYGWEGDPAIPRDVLRSLLLEYGVELMLLPGHSISHRKAAAKWVASTLILGAHNARTV